MPPLTKSQKQRRRVLKNKQKGLDLLAKPDLLNNLEDLQKKQEIDKSEDKKGLKIIKEGTERRKMILRKHW